MQTLRTKKRVKKEKRNVLFHRGQLDPNITLYLICDICVTFVGVFWSIGLVKLRLFGISYMTLFTCKLRS